MIMVMGLSTEYSRTCDTAFCRILEKSYDTIQKKFKTKVDSGLCIPQFGKEADAICNAAIEDFAVAAPLPDGNKDEDNEQLYDRKIEELERLVDAPLYVLYLKQLYLTSEKALKLFKSSMTTEGTEFEAMMKADDLFRHDAEEYTRISPDWSYDKEAKLFKSSLLEIAQRNKKITEIKLQSQKQQQQSMQYLQMQQQQIQAIQQQMTGQNSPWNIGLAYRIPDTTINVQGSYQQGKGNVQISCVPDESLSLLGPNGFVQGVTSGNVGISFNINI